MHIGINTLFLIPGEVGGSETYLIETLKALATLNSNDTFTLFANQENEQYLRSMFRSADAVQVKQENVKAINRTARILYEQLKLPQSVKHVDVDILWSPGYTAPGLCPVPQVVSILDMQYKRFPMDLTWLARLATDILVRLAAHRCKRILTLSDFSRHEILAYLPSTANRVDVSWLAASTRFAEQTAIPANNNAVFQELQKTPYILCVANTYPHKNVNTLVKAFGHLTGQQALQLVLVGGARRGEAAVDEAMDTLSPQTRNRVTRLPRVELNALIWLYQNSQAFVFPSLYEGFGLPILEAMLARTPVIVADTAICREVGGDHAIRCNATDAMALAKTIEYVLSKPHAWRTAWCQEAHDHASRFTWQETARATRDSFERAIQSSERSPVDTATTSATTQPRSVG